MFRMRFLVAWLVFVFSLNVLAAQDCKDPESWVPEVKFKLGDSSFNETLHWISGWSYAVTAQINSQRASDVTVRICACNDTVSSKFLLGVLNSGFSGKSITADQASDFIWQAVQKRFTCPGGK